MMRLSSFYASEHLFGITTFKNTGLLPTLSFTKLHPLNRGRIRQHEKSHEGDLCKSSYNFNIVDKLARAAPAGGCE
jgi:hypothetical protein